jgi:hypothetical protein
MNTKYTLINPYLILDEKLKFNNTLSSSSSNKAAEDFYKYLFDFFDIGQNKIDKFLITIKDENDKLFSYEYKETKNEIDKKKNDYQITSHNKPEKDLIEHHNKFVTNYLNKYDEKYKKNNDNDKNNKNNKNNNDESDEESSDDDNDDNNVNNLNGGRRDKYKKHKKSKKSKSRSSSSSSNSSSSSLPSSDSSSNSSSSSSSSSSLSSNPYKLKKKYKKKFNKRKLMKKLGNPYVPPIMLYNPDLYNNIYTYIPSFHLKNNLMVVEDPILKFQDDLRLIILNGKMYYQ